MSAHKLRCVVVCEDRRQETFARRLLEARPDTYVTSYFTAPRGVGAAEAWVRKRYPKEVAANRARAGERLALVVLVDGDRFGPIARKRQLDDELRAAGREVRGENEPIATLVPTWSIETWLLALEGRAVTESSSLKQVFEQSNANESKRIRSAAALWLTGACTQPSCRDARDEWERLDKAGSK